MGSEETPRRRRSDLEPDTTELLLREALSTQIRAAVAMEGLTGELRSSTAESTRTREAMQRVLDTGLEHRRQAEDRRVREEQASAARVSLATRATAAVWRALQSPLALLLTAIASWVAAVYFGGARAAH